MASVPDFMATASAALGGLGIVSFSTAAVAWFVKMSRREDGPLSAAKAWGGKTWGVWPIGAGPQAAPEWDPRNAIVFAPSDDDGGFGPVDPPDADGDEGFRPLAGGSGVLAAIRERPLEYLAGAAATGFAAGLIVPLFANQNRTLQLLEQLAKRFEEKRPKNG